MELESWVGGSRSLERLKTCSVIESTSTPIHPVARQSVIYSVNVARPSEAPSQGQKPLRLLGKVETMGLEHTTPFLQTTGWIVQEHPAPY